MYLKQNSSRNQILTSALTKLKFANERTDDERTNRCLKLTSKRHTDLKSCVPEVKVIKESDFDVKSRLAPPKSTEIDEKHDSDTEKFSNFNFAKAGAPPVPSRTAVQPGHSLGKIKICQVF